MYSSINLFLVKNVNNNIKYRITVQIKSQFFSDKFSYLNTNLCCPNRTLDTFAITDTDLS